MDHHSFRLNPAIHDEEAFIDPRILAWGEYLSPNVESHPLTDAAADNDQAVAGDAIPAVGQPFFPQFEPPTSVDPTDVDDQALAGNADPAMGQASFAGAQVPSHFGMSHPAHRALDANHAALYYPHGAIYPQASDQVLGADMGHPANEALQAHQAAYGNPSGPTVHGNPTGPTVHDNPHGAGHLVAGPSTARNGRRRPAPWTEEEDQELLRLAAIQNRRGGRMYTYGRMIVSSAALFSPTRATRCTSN